jgi:hypothetical protein
MDGENLKKLSLSTILLAMTLMAFTLVFAPSARASDTVVSVLPATVDITAVGETQTVDINITDVTNLYAYEMKVWYNSSIVNATAAVRPSGHFLEPVDLGSQFVPKWILNYTQNSTHGMCWLGFTLLTPELARNGSGILVRITFKGIAEGSTPIVLNNYPGTSGPIKLANNEPVPIVHTATNGAVNVIQEFLVILLLPIFAITSLIAISIAKLRRKRQIY